jgi:hypothetical protein
MDDNKLNEGTQGIGITSVSVTEANVQLPEVIVKTDYDLHIDEEFLSLIPAMSTDENRGLEASLLSEGPRDPLIEAVLDSDDGPEKYLADGHSRYPLLKKHGLPYRIIRMHFKSREEVKTWIINNQIINRRNLTEGQRAYLIGTRYEMEKKPHGGDRKGEKSSDQNEHLKKTADRVGELFGVVRHEVAERR